MLIKKREVTELSDKIRKAIDGQSVDFRDNREGKLSILKNDIHTLVNLKNEQADAFLKERDFLEETLENISHQLKTPLTSMMIMADLLENAPPDKQEEFTANIKIGLTRMEWLVSVLLKMAKLDNGSIDFSMQTMSVKQLINTALEPLQIMLDVKNQAVELANDTDIYCDKRWTAEALTNVLKNASECSPINSSIYIDCGKNPICTWISVTDSGKGIPKEKISSIFQRFESSQNDKGYGVGLPLSLAIFRGQNGDIEVDGVRNGSGATFTLKLYK